MTLRLKNIFASACLLLLWSINSVAAEEPYENFIKGSIKKNDSLFVKDEKFKNPFFIWSDITNISVRNVLSLRILHEQEIVKDFKLNVLLRVEYFSSPTQVEPTKIDSVKLDVNYEKGLAKQYKELDQYEFTDGYYVKVYVTDVESPEFGTEIPDIFQLTSTIVIDRTYRFLPEMPIQLNGVIINGNNNPLQRAGGSAVMSGSQLQLAWSSAGAAYHYDVEWVTLDRTPENTATLEQLVNDTFTSDDSDDDIIGEFFRNNSTRVTTVVPSYTISLLSNADVILVRIRQVNYLTNGVRNEGMWFYKQETPVIEYAAWEIPVWHESKMNWQYSASFAEEGKKKEVVTYFDGSLRGRQTVTLNNADDIAVVQENIYDQYGRAAASILPAPTREPNITRQSLHYFQKFNTDITGKPYSFLNLNTDFCETLPQILDTASGASQYYSPNNSFLSNQSISFTKYIPNADGYPLSVTQYTADNTGRIKMQGGVGLTFKPGSDDSKTTKYYYGKPDQWELDRIFGNDVGVANHYLKNMVVDPNNQVSISYMNASGKTIATALTGAKPTNLEALPSMPVVKMDTISLIDADKFEFDPGALTLTARTTYLAAVIGTGNIKYNVEQLISRYPGTAYQRYSNAYFDLKILVRNDCLDTVFQQIVAIGSKTSVPTKTALYQNSFDVTFSRIGQYYITFELVMNESIVLHYTNEFIRLGLIDGSVKKETEFILRELAKVNFDDCLSDCKTARERLGTGSEFKKMFHAKLTSMGVIDSAAYVQFIGGLYSHLVLKVDTLESTCNTSSNVCDQYRIPMLADVSPGGQYALFDSLGNVLEQPLNVLYRGFRATKFLPLTATDTVYLANLVTLENGKITSPYDASFTLSDLVKYWKPEWAEQFLDLHPEHCKLEFCNANSVSGNWDEKIRLISSVGEFSKNLDSLAIYSDTNSVWLITYDPFFTGNGSVYAPEMAADLNNYSNNVLKLNSKVPNISIKGLSQYVDYQLYCADSLGTTNANVQPGNQWDNCSKKEECRVIDREWQLYRDLYLELKQKYFERLRDSTTCEDGCPVSIPIAILPGDGVPVAACSEILDLSLYGIQASANSFTNADSYTNTTYTYTLVTGTPGTPPGFANACTGDTPVFYSCLLVYLQNGVQRQFYNVWKYTCSQPTSTCNTSANSFFDVRVNANKIYVFTGSNTRNEITFYPNLTLQTPPAFESCSTYTSTHFVDCYTIYSGTYSEVFYNVWMQYCYYVPYEGDISQRNARTASASSTGKSPVQQIIQNHNFTDTDPRNNEIITADILSNKVYSIIREPALAELAIKGQFTSHEFMAYFAVQIAPKSYLSYKNVWVAELISTKKSSKVAARADEGWVSIQAAPSQSCLQTDFDISGSYNSGKNGVNLVINYSNGLTCSGNNAIVSIYMDRDGNSTHIGTVTILAGQPMASISLAVDVSPSDTFWACGIRPCTDEEEPNPPIPCSSILLTKKSRFGVPDRTDSEDDPNQILDKLNGELHDAIASSCEMNAEAWMQRLAPGLRVRLDADSILLRTKLIELCNAGGDLSHPNGATSLPAGSFIVVKGINCRTFGDVIKAVFNLPKFTLTLNPWLIDAPYPYESGYQPVERGITNTDQAICDRLASLRPAGSTDPQFYTHLQNTYGSAMKLSYADFGLLLSACTNCRFLLKKDLILPQFLEPNSKTCITRSEYTAALTELSSSFNVNLIPAASNYWMILNNYMNFKWGFSLTVDQYAIFAGGEAPILCNVTPFDALAEVPYACEQSLIEFAVGNGLKDYNNYLFEERLKFKQAYIDMSRSTKASAKMFVQQQLYHYTLYYYDQAGNLIRTIPPEGVSPLSSLQVNLVDKARKYVANCTYNGPTTNAVKPTALQDLSTTIAFQGNAAVELWLYKNVSGSQQMIATTPDNKYIFQACANGNLLNIDIYSVRQDSPNAVAITLSNHVTADITTISPLLPWTHIVVQGNRLATGTLSLWINGKLFPAVAGAPSAGCTWQIGTTPTLTLPENITTLKHLRLYRGRLMTATEIKSNAENGCLNASGVYVGWHRFDVPQAGTETTISPTSTAETQFKFIYPEHTLATTYAYNSGNQVVRQYSPDGGTSRFWYDKLGRLIISQNAKQALSDKYSYTDYDLLGRIIEVGEKTALNNVVLKSTEELNSPNYLDDTFYTAFKASGSNSQLTQTRYDTVAVESGLQTGLTQQNLRKRVSATIYRETPASTAVNASYYDYDLAGNVKTLYQQISGLGLKTIGYEYDLASGKVNFLSYQHDNNDRFYYGYDYDAENRLTKAWSSTTADVVSYGIGSKLNFTNKKLDASYSYYLHGPLARMELGKETDKVQGLDYAYTLQGWLKGVNGNALVTTTEQGLDGATIGRDAIAYSLGYYPGDYTPIGGGTAYAMQWQPGGETGNPLYNGNISNSTVAIREIGGSTPIGYTYAYDQLNRLKKMRQYDLTNNTTTWNSSNINNKYKEDYTYDGNGNILTLERHGPSADVVIDQLIYRYNRDSNGKLVNNKLNQLEDTRYDATPDPGELNGETNYVYDAIGNLVSDSKEKIKTINWNLYGKIKSITKGEGADTTVQVYSYDASGNRVSKTLPGLTTWYVRDAQGNPLGVYDNAGGAINWREQQLYGSSRLGMWKPDIDIAATNGTSIWSFANKKNYELSNHLGNVLAVITDAAQVRNGIKIDSVISAQDYYPFGMVQPDRSLSTENYRYGFNGKENDNDVKGTGNQQDYGMRIYDPRVGRFTSIDPLQKQYPELTPYQFSSNTPIQASDLDGLEADFSKGKVNLLEYHKEDGVEAKVNTFGVNTGLTIYNGVVDMVEMAANLSPVVNLFQGGKGFKKIYNTAENAVTGVYNWTVNSSWSEKGQDLKNAASNPHTYEGVVALVITHKLAKITGTLLDAEIPVLKTKPTPEGVVYSRINVANGRTRFTPLRPSSGQPSFAGFTHVVDDHFNRAIANNRSVFTISQDELKSILQSSPVVKTTPIPIEGGQYVRTVDIGRPIGTTSLKQGGTSTSRLQVITDNWGNLITTYPVK